MIRLLIADDHAIMRSGLKQIFTLASDFSVAGEASTADDLLPLLQQHTFDLLLLDLNMPGISGVDLIQRVRKHRPDLPILVLTMHNEPQVVARALKAGANGYITKDCEPELLLAAIRKVAAGGQFIAPDLAEKMIFAATSATSAPPHTQLSDREMEVFTLLSHGRSVGEIAAQLAISSKTVSTHKVRLFEKLDISGMADLMRYAMQHRLLG